VAHAFPGAAAAVRRPAQGAVLAFAGYPLRERIAPRPEWEPCVNDSLDEIEYVTAPPAPNRAPGAPKTGISSRPGEGMSPSAHVSLCETD
jgi:hypothetical protein